MKRLILTVLLASLFLFGCTTAQNGAKTTVMNETVFIGGTVAAGPQQVPQHDLGILTSDGIVREVGPAAAIKAAHPKARLIDASNATILPGLTDAHGHLYGLGLSLDTVN